MNSEIDEMIPKAFALAKQQQQQQHTPSKRTIHADLLLSNFITKLNIYRLQSSRRCAPLTQLATNQLLP